MIKTEPAVLNTQLWGMSSRLYPSNVQHVLNKDPSRRVFFEYATSCKRKEDCWQGVLVNNNNFIKSNEIP